MNPFSYALSEIPLRYVYCLCAVFFNICASLHNSNMESFLFSCNGCHMWYCQNKIFLQRQKLLVISKPNKILSGRWLPSFIKHCLHNLYGSIFPCKFGRGGIQNLLHVPAILSLFFLTFMTFTLAYASNNIKAYISNSPDPIPTVLETENPNYLPFSNYSFL